MSLQARRRLWSFFEALYSQELTETASTTTTPTWIKTPLMDHQRTSLAAALALEQSKQDGVLVDPLPGEADGGRFFTSYGILADKVGSGKSLTALALVKQPPPSDLYTEYITRHNQILGDGRDIGLLRQKSQRQTSAGVALRQVTTSLLLVPHALIQQWETYVTRDTTLRAKILKRKADTSDPALMADLETYDLIIVSSTMWPTFKASHPIRTILWQRLFIDEADSIAFSSDHDDLHARFYWFITASWMNLIFTGGCYYNIMSVYTPLPETPLTLIERIHKSVYNNNYFSVPGCRHQNIVRRMCGTDRLQTHPSSQAVLSQSARVVIHSTEEAIRRSFSNPLIAHSTIVCATPANLRVLESFVSPEMMERLHAGDVKGALESVGMTAHSESELTTAVTASWLTELDNAKKTYEFKKTITYSSEAARIKSFETCEQKIASIESRISAVEDRIKRAKEHSCPICCCEATNPALTPCCTQIFCFGCLCESLKRAASCPLCRVRISDLKSVKVLGEGNETNTVTVAAPKKKKLGKQETCIAFLKEHPSARVLIFSSYDATFSGLNTSLTDAGITHATVNGSQARITKLLREFKEGKHSVLFLNARNMGAGLNMESATHVLLFHRMAAELEQQIVGRAVRLGRTEPLEVIHLYHENELQTGIAHS